MLMRLGIERFEARNPASLKLSKFLDNVAKSFSSKTEALIKSSGNRDLIEYDQRLREMQFVKGLGTVALDTTILSAVIVTAPFALAADAIYQRRILNRHQRGVAFTITAGEALMALTACAGQAQPQVKPGECINEGRVEKCTPPTPTTTSLLQEKAASPTAAGITLDLPQPSNESQKVVRFGKEVDLNQFDQAILTELQKKYPDSNIQLIEHSRNGNTGQGCYAGCVRRDGINSDSLTGTQAIDVLLGANYERIGPFNLASTNNLEEKLARFNKDLLPTLLPGDHLFLLGPGYQTIHCATYTGSGFSQTIGDNLPTFTSNDFKPALGQYSTTTSIGISRPKR
ncbi:MAG: hypothetical protein WCP97_08460 [bacterium]